MFYSAPRPSSPNLSPAHLSSVCRRCRLLESRAHADANLDNDLENDSELTSSQRIKHMRMLFGFAARDVAPSS